MIVLRVSLRENQKTKVSRMQTESKPSNRQRHKQKSHDITQCSYCLVRYGAEDDARMSDDWVKCAGCSKCYQESCAEVVRILDDAEFYYKDCF